MLITKSIFPVLWSGLWGLLKEGGGRGVKGGTLHRNLSPIRPHKVGKHIGSLMDCHVSWHDHTKQICFKITSKNIMAKVQNFQEKQTLTCITHLFIPIYIWFYIAGKSHSWYCKTSKQGSQNNIKVLTCDKIRPHYVNQGLLKFQSIVKLPVHTRLFLHDHLHDDFSPSTIILLIWQNFVLLL